MLCVPVRRVPKPGRNEFCAYQRIPYLAVLVGNESASVISSPKPLLQWAPLSLWLRRLEVIRHRRFQSGFQVAAAQSESGRPVSFRRAVSPLRSSFFRTQLPELMVRPSCFGVTLVAADAFWRSRPCAALSNAW